MKKVYLIHCHIILLIVIFLQSNEKMSTILKHLSKVKKKYIDIFIDCHYDIFSKIKRIEGKDYSIRYILT